ncbi:MAG: NAD(P)H-hydrate dehydratase, partial [Clostridia bacterium]
CGLLEVAVPGTVKQAFCALPEACCTVVNQGDGWDETANQNAVRLLPGKQAVGIGCGMGEATDTHLLYAALQANIPLVLDADALNLLAKKSELKYYLHQNVILTPHAGEMARLLGCSITDVTQNSIDIAIKTAKRWNCVVLLKGATTVIASPTNAALNKTGNPGLSKGGSGDVLTGLLTGLLAQGLSSFDAACTGAYLLGLSADQALMILGNRMLMASDVVGAVEMTLGQLTAIKTAGSQE